ncbi:MAG: ABC transporter ATP-binding protein [Bacteroidetes bacterium]|nr:ABC transporter ATP-binding protein [Bacteroidota bacterium]
MKIQLDQIGKKFNTEWIFRNVSFSFEENSVSAILGRNGSGKSTLLQVVAGNLHPTAGKVVYTHGGQTISSDEIFRHLAMVAPYLELIEDFTLDEMLAFHFSFKRYLPGYDIASVTDLLQFPAMKHKQIRQFSSGMKQRVKLVLAILSDVPILLLDEPTMNLDKTGIDWYLELVHKFAGSRSVIICSNLHQTESAFATKSLQIEEFKQ